jgi:hypothetical protein
VDESSRRKNRRSGNGMTPAKTAIQYLAVTISS